MQQQPAKCKKCNQVSVWEHAPYQVPHIAHLLAIIALGLFIHPIAAIAWAAVWGFHAVMNLGGGGGKCTCTRCGQRPW